MQEALDLVCDTLDCISYLADTVLNAVHDAVDDVSAPLECLRCKPLDEADSGIEAVDYGALDCRDFLRNGGFDAIPDRRNGRLDRVQHIADRSFDAVPDVRYCIFDGVQHAADKSADRIPDRRNNGIDCI